VSALRQGEAQDVSATDWVNRCHFGDVRDVLRRMAADGVKVQTIVTSPPYWGLRSYLPAEHPDKAREIGSEPTLGEFLATMVEVFGLCREVLADDGTMWVNMGDSYASGGRTTYDVASANRGNSASRGLSRPADQLPPKNLIGQPWRLAFALQDDGWILRQGIVWHKPNPMPESVTDRCTNSHEFIFHLAKQERYYFDQEAILEPTSPGTHARLSQNVQAQIGSERANGGAKKNGNMKAVGRRGVPPKAPADGGGLIKNNGDFNAAMSIMPAERNKRSVWTVPTESYSGAHFATFPRKLIEPCILAGAPVGGIVLDIFMGSGTTAQVAEKLGRQWIGIDIDERNAELQRGRLIQPSLLLEVAA
jgi:DNA modification methylase